jgi:nicotinate-nucleotide adenylyltransferase
MNERPPRALVGVFGGTFNPIHVGHLRAAEEVADALALARVIFVPSAEPPHKAGSAADPIAPARDRLAWVRLAARDNPRFEVDPIEVDRGGSSYSVETLRAIGARTRPERPVFVIGLDAFREIDTWREPEALLGLAHFAVITRPPFAPRAGGGRASLADWLPPALRPELELSPGGLSARHRRAGTWIGLLDIHALDVSSSDIRARLREGRSVRYLIPEPALEEILKSGAYAAGAGAPGGTRRTT